MTGARIGRPPAELSPARRRSLEQAAQAVREAESTLARARARLDRAVVAADRDGASTRTIAAAIGKAHTVAVRALERGRAS